jgi:hypothetical protein
VFQESDAYPNKTYSCYAKAYCRTNFTFGFAPKLRIKIRYSKNQWIGKATKCHTKAGDHGQINPSAVKTSNNAISA